MKKIQLQKHITKTVNRLLYRLNNETNGGDIGSCYMKLLKDQARSDCKFFGTGTVATQSKFFFIDHLIDAMEYPDRYTIADVIKIIPSRIYAESLSQNWFTLIEETFKQTEFPIKEFKKVRYSQLFSESI
tara:strand:- start:95 stop:484 length:390 start_codon:yes stop_codon:yes gene_type:complete